MILVKFTRRDLLLSPSLLSLWYSILRGLKAESPWKGCLAAIEDEKYINWLKKEWQINITVAPPNLTEPYAYISELELDEASYTMLILKYQKDNQ